MIYLIVKTDGPRACFVKFRTFTLCNWLALPSLPLPAERNTSRRYCWKGYHSMHQNMKNSIDPPWYCPIPTLPAEPQYQSYQLLLSEISCFTARLPYLSYRHVHTLFIIKKP